MLKINYALGALVAVVATSPALAERGDILFKLRGNYHLRIEQEKTSVSVDQRSGEAALYNVRGSDSAGGELSAAFFLSNEIAAELAFGISSNRSTESSGRELFNSGMISPSVSIQYHPVSTGRVRPYVGVGGAFVSTYSERTGDLLTYNPPYPPVAYSVDVSSRMAPMVQIGSDISLDEKLYLNLDAKYTRSREKFTISELDAVETYRHKVNMLVVGVGVGFRF